MEGTTLRLGQKSCGCLRFEKTVWTNERLDQLRNLVSQGLSTKEMAKQTAHSQSARAIRAAMGKYKISSQYKPPAARCFTCKVQLNDRNRYLTHKRPQCKTCAKESATETRRRRARLDPTYKARELERLKKWQANNPEKVRHKNTQRKRSPIPKDRLPLEHWKTINTAFNCRCAYCDCWLEKESSDNPRSRVIEHVVPFSRGGRNDYTNIVPACRQCNSSKGTKNLRQWINDDQRYDFIVQTMGDIDYVLAPPPLPRPRTPATHMCTFGAEIRWPIRRIYAPPPPGRRPPNRRPAGILGWTATDGDAG